jgi:hypothetical protein
MRLSLLRVLPAMAAAYMLSGCSAAQPDASLSGAVPEPNGRGGMPSSSQGHDMLYVTEGEDVNVYAYPGGKLLGSLGNVGGSVCSDRFGDVFISQYYSDDVVEYAHGAEIPKATLETPSFAGACSVDPTTGSVAVMNGGGGSGIVIFPYTKKNGWRFARMYTIPNMSGASFCGYDGRGNLFVDGGDSSGFAFAEMPKGAKKFKPVTLNQSIEKAGPIQWDGTYVTVADLGEGSRPPVLIYQFRISGSAGIKAGSTTLSDSYGNSRYWIQGDRIVGAYLPQKYLDGIAIWAYPAGGSPLKTFASASEADDVTVSLAN